MVEIPSADILMQGVLLGRRRQEMIDVVEATFAEENCIVIILLDEVVSPEANRFACNVKELACMDHDGFNTFVDDWITDGARGMDSTPSEELNRCWDTLNGWRNSIISYNEPYRRPVAIVVERESGPSLAMGSIERIPLGSRKQFSSPEAAKRHGN